MYEGVSVAVIEGEERQQTDSREPLESVDHLQNNQIRLDVCKEEANRHISLIAAEPSQLDTNIEDDDWSTEVKSIQKNTLELQRKLSAEFKPEQLNDHLLLSRPPTSSKLSRLKLTSTAPKVTPNDKAERQVLELKEQLLSIEPLLNTHETVTNHSRREEIKLKLKGRQKELKNMESSQSVTEESTNTRPNTPVKPKKGLAPQPPQKTTPTSPQMQSIASQVTPQSPKTVSKQSGPATLGMIPRPTSLGAQWKRMQRSKSVKFLTDTSPLRKNLKGIKRAFKTSEDILPSPSPTPPTTPRRNSIAVTEGIDWPDTTLARYLEPLEFPIAEDCSTPIQARKMSEAIGARNRFKYLPEIAEMISTMTGTDFDNDEDAVSVSSESEGEEQAISENALQEIEAFEKLIADYMREIAQQMSSSEDLSQESENYIS